MSELELLPCPFCAGTNTLIRTMEHWTGQRSIVTQGIVRHWCDDGQPASFLQIKAKTVDEAVSKWNTRL
jgi:hypothetical protein